MKRIFQLLMWPLVAVVLIVLVLVAVLAKPAAGHTGLFTASPAPGATVGGEFSTYQLVFNEVVTEVEVWMEDPQQVRFAVSQENEAGSVITFNTDPLPADGLYIVRYTLTSADGDPIRSGYAFQYEASAPEPLPAVVPAILQAQTNWAYRLALGGVIGSVVALSGLFLWRYRQLRKLRAQPVPISD